MQMLYPKVPVELAEIRAAEREGRPVREIPETEKKKSPRNMPCVAYYGVADFSRFQTDGPFPRPYLFDHILGKEGAKDPENTARISPVTYIRPDQDYPPFLLIHGDMDSVVPFEQSEIMFRKLQECGKRADFYQVRGAGHGSGFWTEEVLDITGQFFKAYV